jgi:hypothetical protein
MFRKSTGPLEAVKTSDPGSSISSGGLGVPGGTFFLSSSQSTGPLGSGFITGGVDKLSKFRIGHRMFVDPEAIN